jgi:lia operon protein LiaG
MRFVAILPFVPFVLAGPAMLAAQQERHSLEGDDVAIYNLAGEVSVEAGQGSIGVLLTRGGAGAGQLRVAQGEIDGRETLRVIYPSDHIVYPPVGSGSSTQLRVRDDGTFGDEHDHGHGEHARGRRVTIMDRGDGLEAHADLRISVPRGRTLAVHLAVGKVTVSNVNGRISIDADNAPVTASGTQGELSVDVGSGDVRVSQTEGDLSVDTAITAPPTLSASVEIETASGDIESDFPLTVTRRASDHVEGRIGDGKGTIAIETGSGGIRLLKGPE